MTTRNVLVIIAAIVACVLIRLVVEKRKHPVTGPFPQPYPQQNALIASAP